MSVSTAKNSYHHGNLKEAATRAAIDLIDNQGIDACSLRAVARRLNVAHTSLYEHFPDKTALYSAVAEQGYLLLAARLRRAMKKDGTANERLKFISLAYIKFARDKPSHYKVMSDPALTGGMDSPQLSEAHDSATRYLYEVVQNGVDSGNFAQRNVESLAMTLWSFVHGYTEIYRNRRGVYYGMENPSLSVIERDLSQSLENLLTGLSA